MRTNFSVTASAAKCKNVSDTIRLSHVVFRVMMSKPSGATPGGICKALSERLNLNEMPVYLSATGNKGHFVESG